MFKFKLIYKLKYKKCQLNILFLERKNIIMAVDYENTTNKDFEINHLSNERKCNLFCCLKQPNDQLLQEYNNIPKTEANIFVWKYEDYFTTRSNGFKT